MYYIGNIFIGILVSLLIFANGLLSKVTDDTTALIIVHLLGFITILIVKMFNKNKITSWPRQFYFYTGGIFSIAIILLENITMKKIGISLTVLFLIIGQIFSSIFIDHFGLFDRSIYKFDPKKGIGLLIILTGIIILNV